MKPKDIEKIRSQIERLKLQNKTELMPQHCLSRRRSGSNLLT